MRRPAVIRLLLTVSVFVLIGCTAQTTTRTAGLVGANDMVLVDLLSGPNFPLANEVGRPLPDAGIRAQFFFITSTDTNELKVLFNYRPTLQGRDFYPAPNPLETLSIPVPDRPTVLAVDEGLQAVGTTEGRRVTGSYVYSTRPGASRIAVVGTSPSEFRQVIDPIAAGGPVTAMVAFMNPETGNNKLGDSLPNNTQLYFGTSDGEVGLVYRVSLPTSVAALLPPFIPVNERLVSLPNENISALLALPAFTGRNVDGRPFCATETCLVVGTRAKGGKEGRTFVFEPSTKTRVSVAFPGPVRELKMALDDPRIYAILDEEYCGSPACGGVIGADTRVATGNAFPLVSDSAGQTMLPIRVGNTLPQALALASNLPIRRTVIDTADGGGVGLVLTSKALGLLGSFTSSDGQLTFFDGEQGLVIDFDGRRGSVTSAVLNAPFIDDAGSGFDLSAAIVRESAQSLEPVMTSDVYGSDAGTVADFSVEVGDGFFTNQSLFIENARLIPGLTSVGVTENRATIDLPAGTPARVQTRDVVEFYDGTNSRCDTTEVVSVTGSFALLKAAPTSCSTLSRYQVRAGPMNPMVVSSDVEGYVGRGNFGEVLVYQRRYQHYPLPNSPTRTALKLTLPKQMPQGSFWSLTLTSRFSPYRTSIDLNACSASFLTRPVMATLPTNIQNNYVAIPTVMMSSPSANAVVEVNLNATASGILTNADNGIQCRQ
jgi:hypothetical protein